MITDAKIGFSYGDGKKQKGYFRVSELNIPPLRIIMNWPLENTIFISRIRFLHPLLPCSYKAWNRHPRPSPSILRQPASHGKGNKEFSGSSDISSRVPYISPGPCHIPLSRHRERHSAGHDGRWCRPHLRWAWGSEESSEEIGESSEESSEKPQDLIQAILGAIKVDAKVTAAEIAMQLGVSSRAVEKRIRTLRENGVIRRVGPNKGGSWEIINEI